MQRTGIYEAKNNFSALIETVENGEEVRITRHGKEVAMPYRTAPESALDDPDEMAGWARKAYEAGLRSGK